MTNDTRIRNPLAQRALEECITFDEWQAAFAAAKDKYVCIGLLYALSRLGFTGYSERAFPFHRTFPLLLELSDGHSCSSAFEAARAWLAQEVSSRAFKVLIESCFAEPKSTMVSGWHHDIANNPELTSALFAFVDGDDHRENLSRNMTGMSTWVDQRLLQVFHHGIMRFARALWMCGERPDKQYARALRPRLVPVLARITDYWEGRIGSIRPEGLSFFQDYCDRPTLDALARYGLQKAQEAHRAERRTGREPRTLRDAINHNPAVNTAYLLLADRRFRTSAKRA